ncbi:MAG: hypothetical protein WA188_09870 [Terriglobales bacterium]
MIIFTGNNDAVSFTDEGSPDARVTGDKVCIDGQVNRDLSLDWYYRIIQLFPDVKGELKSKEVAERFKNFPTGQRTAIWTGLRRVKIHIVDPRCHRHRINNLLRNVWKNDQAPELLAQDVHQGLPCAKYIAARLREMVADSILNDSTAMRVQFLGRAFLDPFGLNEPPEPLRPFMGSPRPSSPLLSTEDFSKPKSLIRDVTSWSAKASAAFHAALDAATTFDEDILSTRRFADGDFFRRKMAAELLPVHAFDEGNQKHLNLLEDVRSEVFQELAAHDRVYGLIQNRRCIVPAESKESFYVQAADIAAGIASHIYASEGLVGVIDHFEYITYNGVRVSRADAEEEMRRMEIMD